MTIFLGLVQVAPSSTLDVSLPRLTRLTGSASAVSQYAWYFRRLCTQAFLPVSFVISLSRGTRFTVHVLLHPTVSSTIYCANGFAINNE